MPDPFPETCPRCGAGIWISQGMFSPDGEEWSRTASISCMRDVSCFSKAVMIDLVEQEEPDVE